MNSILAIVFVCGVGVACGHTVTSSRRNGAFESLVDGEAEVAPAEETDGLTPTNVDAQTRAVEDFFERNERLVAALDKAHNALAFKATNGTEKQTVTLLALFFVHYFDADTGSFENDIKQAFRKTFQVTHKPAYVVAAPVRTLLAKFVAVVANRIGHVQDLCKNKKDCSLDVLQRDTAEKLICPRYYRHAYMHNLALNRIENGAALLTFLLDITPHRRSEDSSLVQSEVVKFKDDLLICKAVFKILKSLDYPCFNVNSVNDYVE